MNNAMIDVLLTNSGTYCIHQVVFQPEFNFDKRKVKLLGELFVFPEPLFISDISIDELVILHTTEPRNKYTIVPKWMAKFIMANLEREVREMHIGFPKESN